MLFDALALLLLLGGSVATLFAALRVIRNRDPLPAVLPTPPSKSVLHTKHRSRRRPARRRPRSSKEPLVAAVDDSDDTNESSSESDAEDGLHRLLLSKSVATAAPPPSRELAAVVEREPLEVGWDAAATTRRQDARAASRALRLAAAEPPAPAQPACDPPDGQLDDWGDLYAHAKVLSS